MAKAIITNFCQVCSTPLPRGVEVYGGIGETFCFLHWQERVPIGPMGSMAKSRKEWLEDLVKKLENRAIDAQADADEAQEKLDRIETRIAAIENELNGHKRCDEIEWEPHAKHKRTDPDHQAGRSDGVHLSGLPGLLDADGTDDD